MAPVNYLAVLVSAVVSMVIGSIWYGPIFGKQFMRAMGMDQWTPEKQAEMKKKMWMSYVGQFIASFVMFYILGGLVVGFGHTTVHGGLLTAFIVWVGFVLPLKVGDLLWGGKASLFWLTSGNMLLTLLAAGAILGGWN